MSLYLEHITQRFGQTLALNDIDLEIRNGEFLAILGPSGCGKTTLLRAIGGFAKPTEGKIRMDDVIYSGNGKMVPVEQRDLGMVFQSFALWPNMTVRQHVEFPMKSPKQKHLTEAQKKEAVDAAIENMVFKSLCYFRSIIYKGLIHYFKIGIIPLSSDKITFAY